jgi:tetratricopeptide (TPR) repeat protein
MRLSPRAVVVSAILLSGCAARTPAPPTFVNELGQAHALLNVGCYECLREALAIYDRIAIVKNAPAEARHGAFNAAVLLLVRAKELGLPEGPALERARSRAAELPPGSADAFFAAIALTTGESSGFDPEQRETRGRARRQLWPNDGSIPPSRSALTPLLESDVVAQYIALAVDCDDARLRKEIAVDEVRKRYPIPLIAFRLTLCGFNPAGIESFRDADARWLETFFFQGRREMLSRPAPDIGLAATLLATAHETFADSHAVTLALANARNALTEYQPALDLFDSVLAKEPTHRDALLGRILSLSYLARHADAVAAATHMIDLGTWHMGDAYYWRAWNRYHLYQLDAAWDDVERATKLNVTSTTFTLAGVIAFARRELDTAIDRLSRAFKLDPTNCEAPWTEGLVHVEKQTWEMSGQRFAQATRCFAATADEARREIADTQASNYSEAVKTRRIGGAQKRLDGAEHRGAQSAYNAASSYVRIGQKAEALLFIDLAAVHPLMKEKAISLKGVIEKMP